MQHLFNSYCRKVLQNAANDYYDSLIRRRKRETLIDDCGSLPIVTDTYDVDSTTYIVFGEEVKFTDPSIVDVLNQLTEDGRTIVLAAYVLDLPDRVIAERLHMVRRTVAYRRLHLLQDVREALLCSLCL